MSKLGMRVAAAVAAGICVDDRRGQMRDFVKECMARSFCDVVCLTDRPALVDRDLGFGVQPMADPADADLPYPLDTGHLGEDRFRLVAPPLIADFWAGVNAMTGG